jgi:hypothetical protein
MLERLRKESITIKRRIRKRRIPRIKRLTRTLTREIFARCVKNIEVGSRSATTSDYRTLYYGLKTC